jgi:hypothetical protein
MSFLRAGILVGGVVIGGLIIANAFPTPGGPAAAPVTQHSPTPMPSSHPGSPQASPQVLVCGSPQGVKIAVENAANSTGLAAATATKLKAAGYTFNATTDISDALSRQTTTTVFYRTPVDKHPAACLKQKFFPGAFLKPMSAGGTAARPAFSRAAGVAVFLGTDYARTHPVP